jgi:hypothetical protein
MLTLHSIPYGTIEIAKNICYSRAITIPTDGGLMPDEYQACKQSPHFVRGFQRRPRLGFSLPWLIGRNVVGIGHIRCISKLVCSACYRTTGPVVWVALPILRSTADQHKVLAAATDRLDRPGHITPMVGHLTRQVMPTFGSGVSFCVPP